MAMVVTDGSDSSRTRRAFGIGGGLKLQLMTYTCDSASTSATITADALIEVSAIYIDGVVQTAAPTYSGNQVTITFAAPGASIVGDIIAIGV